MKRLATLILTLSLVCLCQAMAAAQAGRHSTETPKATYPVPPPEESESVTKIGQDTQNHKIYQCLDERIELDPTRSVAANEVVFSPKDVDTKAKILSRPQPHYTREARSNGTSGRVVMKALLSSSSKVTSVEAITELPDGLTESAVKAACALRFEPAMKDGHEVSQYVIVEYGFMIDHRSGPGMRRLPSPSRP
ncbi:MAG: Gram-negative bacterial TonB protein C-terminal [Blastocatellia bacterium]|jgi:outer membrane biosynthesis protein TonB|nr:Gram-negative bacterial TonB protein C-terminal [Blastocatellia bacterium]